ncbi:hypothetical protein TrRE_jg4650, partial [Triparma retinervis]
MRGALLPVYGNILGININSYQCTKCEAGFYSEAEGELCTPCKAGFNSSVIAATNSSVCSACAAGTYSLIGSESCSICLEGKWSSETGTGECTACPGGKVLSDRGTDRLDHDSSQDCLACGKGWYSRPGSSACTVCWPGTYSDSELGSANCTLCPPGRYGSSEGLGSESCTGPCEDGFACDAGSTSPSGGCPLGMWLSNNGQCKDCPAGSGPCTEGWHCPPGSTNSTHSPCPPHAFCAPGSLSPESCPPNYAKPCLGEGVGTCEDGTLCLDGQCAGLSASLNCQDGSYDFAFCASLAAVLVRDLGEVGCARGSACEKFLQVEETLGWLSWLGGVDVAAVGAGLVLVAGGAMAGGETERRGKRALLYFVLPVDIILIVGVELVGYESEMDDIVDSFLAGGCWKSFYGYVRADGLATGLGFVKIMGFFAIATKLITVYVLRKDVKREEGGKSGGDGGGASFWLLGFSSAFSVLNYVQFILGLVNAFSEFGEGVGNSTVVSGTDAFVPCVEIEELYDPVPTKSTTNCLKGEDVSKIKVTGNLEVYLACIIGMGVCYGLI